MDMIKNLISGKPREDETAPSSGVEGQSAAHGPFSGESSHLQSATNPGTSTGLTGQHGTTTTGVGSNTSTGLGNTQGSGLTSGTTTTSGPHSSNLANKADPRVDSDNSQLTGSSRIPGGWDDETTNHGTSGAPQTSTTSDHHLGRDAAAVGMAGAVGEGLHHHNQEQRDLPIRSNDHSNTASNIAHPGTSQLESSGQNPTTSGTASSGVAGVNPGTSSAGYPASTQGSSGLGSSHTTQPSTTTSTHHLGRDAAALGAGGAAAEGLHSHNEREREFPLSSTTGPSAASTAGSTTAGSGYTGPGVGQGSHFTGPSGSATGTSGPHKLDLANRLDPAVNTSGTGLEDAHRHDPLEGGGAEAADQEHHLGRGAGLGAGALGAAGLAEHEHRKHETTGQTSGTSNVSGSGSDTTGPHNKEWMNKLDPRVSSNQQQGVGSTGQDHHYGRDTAVAGGVGGAAYEADKHFKHDKDLTQAERDAKRDHKHELKEEKKHHHEEKQHHLGRDAAAAGGVGGAAYETDKHHNKHDQGLAHDGREHHLGRDTAVAGGVGGAAYEADQHHKHDKDLTQAERDAKRDHKHEMHEERKHHNDHHLGRDAAVAGGVGGAAYEADKHHNQPDHSTLREAGLARGSGPAGTTGASSGAQSGSGLVVDPSATSGHPVPMAAATEHGFTPNPFKTNRDARDVTPLSGPGSVGMETGGLHNQSNPSTTQHNDHHLGRDAGAAAGVGALGYEAEKHHHNQSTTATNPTTTQHNDHHLGRDAGVAAGVGGAGYEAERHNNQSNPTTTQHNDHHLGRDAGVAAGVGGVGYEAEKHHAHDKDLKHEEKEAKKEHKLEEKELKKEQKYEEKEAKKEQKYEEKEAKKEHKHEEKEVKKEHKSHGLLSFLHRDKSKKYSPEEEAEFDRQEREHNRTAGQSSHVGRDAALGAGAVGAAGYGVHEHDQHGHNAVPLDEKPRGSDLGDKLHGVDRNRGVVGGSGLPGTQGYGSGTSGVHSEATTDQSGRPIGSGQEHHLGRDAAVGGAGLGAAGLAEHEHNKHSQPTSGGIQSHSYPSGQSGSTAGYPSNTSNPTSTGTGHHLGRDAAVAGGVGGIAEHEHRQHGSGIQDTTGPGRTTSTTASTSGIYEGQSAGSSLPSSGLNTSTSTGQPGTGDYDPYSTSKTSSVVGAGAPAVLGSKVSEGSDGRHRLHKDPPADHPASQATFDAENSGVAHGTGPSTGNTY